jgi:predicted transcriptional regulator
VTELRVVVPDEIAERLAERARESHVTPEELAGEAVASFLGPTTKHVGTHRLSFIGIGRSGSRDSVAERHDEVIREHFSNKTAADV